MKNRMLKTSRWVMCLVLILFTVTTSGDVKANGVVPVSPGDIDTTNIEVGSCPSFTWALNGAQQVKTTLLVWLIEGDTNDTLPETLPRKQVIKHLLPAGARVWTPNRRECLRGNRRYAWSVRARGQKEWPQPLYFNVAGEVSTDAVRAALEAIGSSVPTEVTHGNRVPASAPGAVDSVDHTSAQIPELHGQSAFIAPSASLLTGADATALRVEAAGTSGITYGIHGITKSIDRPSAGLIGQSTAGNGFTYGVVGVVASPNGFGGVFDNTGGGDAIRGFSADVEVFSVTSEGFVTAVDFVGDGSELFPYVTGLACTTPCVNGQEIIDESITGSRLQADAVNSRVISGGVVNAFHIASNAVGSSELAANSIENDGIADFSVGSAEIQSNAVGEDELANSGVHGIDVADNAITRSKILGTEVAIYEIHASCADDGDLTLSATCVSVRGSCSAGQFQTCGGGCTGSQQSCSNSLEGFLMEP